MIIIKTNESDISTLIFISFIFLLLLAIVPMGSASSATSCDTQFPVPNYHIAETYDGDLIVSGNDNLLIENKTFIVNGNIYISGNASLIIRNSTLEVRHYPRQEISVIESGIVDADNVTFKGFIHSSFMGQTTLKMQRVFLINLISFGDQAQGTISNSCIFQTNVGLVQAGGYAKVLIDNSTVGAIGLFIPAQYNISVDKLEPGYFEHWSVKENISSSMSFDILLNHTDIKDNPGYSGGFEMGWNIFVTSENNISISDSVLNKFVITFNDENVQISNLIRRKPVNFNLKSIQLQNTTVQGQWGIFVTRGDTLIENSDGVWLWPVGDNNTVVTNTSINEFDPRQYKGKIILSNASMTDGFEIFDNSIFRMEGSVRFLETTPLFSTDSRMTRNYKVMLLDGRYYKPLSNITLALTKNGTPVWNGITDEDGYVNFDIPFDIGNYQNSWILSSSNITIDLQKAIYITTSTPVIINMEPSPQDDRLWSVVYVDCQNDSPGDGTKNSPYTTIQKGMDNAIGGLVRVASGTCLETVNLKDNVILQGNAPDNTSITGNVFAWNISGARISDFTITDTDSAGIHIYNSFLTITNNIIRDQPHNGIHSVNSSLTIINNILTGNGHNGIQLLNSSHATVKNNIMINNGYYAINGNDLSSAIIDYNDVWQNSLSGYGGVILAGAHDLHVDPLFINANNDNFRLLSSSPAINAGDPDPIYYDTDGSRNDMGAFGGPYFEQTPTTTITPAPTVISNPATGGGGSSGSGGGGGGGSGENYSNIKFRENYDLSVYKDKITSYRFTGYENPIRFVNITANTNAGDINAAVEVLRSTSSLLNTSAPGIVYRNVNIWIGTVGFAVPAHIKDAHIVFRIDRSWLENNLPDSGKIIIVRWNGNSWEQLGTREISQDNEFVYFDGTTNAFSPFAITGLISGDVPTVTPTIAVTETPINPTSTATSNPIKETPGFGVIMVLTAFSAVYILRKK